MSIIEKAVERLDQLKRAGVEELPQATEEPVTVLPGASSMLAGAPSPHSGVTSRRVEIDLDRLSALGMISPTNPRTLLAEEYRVIKRPLLRNLQERSGAAHRANLIMVTSSVPGEGKSFTSINLALSIAMELDHTVLLVDADVSRSSILNLLGLPPAPGLMDVMRSPEVSLSDVMLRTNIEKLSLLPAGMPHQRATELLASDAMSRLLDEMAERYPDRVIVFDSPPLLVTTEARVLASHMGQVVMVVEAGRTTHAMVRQAVGTIEACPIKMMLMNKTREPGPGGYYGNYKSYGHYKPYGHA